MRRAPIVLAATVAGFVGVLSFHTSGTTITVSGPGASSSSGSASSATGRATSSSGGGSGTSSTGTSSGGGGSGSSPTKTTPKSADGPSSGNAGASSSGRATSPSSSSSGGASSGASTGARTATGVSENFGYGVMSVKVTVSGKRLLSVKVASLQVAEPTSQYICQQAIPMLHSEVLQAQSARINAISGATYTSEAYAYSLQSALDKLHFR